MSVFIGHSSGSKPATAAAAAADILEAELALGGTPGATHYYGTNASSVRGFYPLPTGGGGGSTNLGVTPDASTVTLTSTSGTGAVIPAATITLAGAMTAADRIKLNGISAFATQNATDAQLRDRTTHTGQQPMSSVTGLAAALAGKADLSSAAFGNLSSTDYFTIADTASSFTMTLEFSDELTNNQTIWLPNQSGTLALVGHTHTADNLTDATSLGKAVMRLTTPPATRFAAFNAEGTVTLLDEPNFRSAIGACAGDDARLSDARTPTAHTHPVSAISDSTAVGKALMTATDPGAIRYVRINENNSVSLLDAAAFLTAIGGSSGGGSPAGTGTEIQYRNAGAFAAVTNSSVSGGTITLGDAENYGASTQALIALRNTTAATNPGVAQSNTGQQASPAFQLEGQSWDYTGGVAASTPVRVRGYVLPQTPHGLGSTPNVVFRLESQVASGAWTRLVDLRQSAAQGFLASFGTGTGILLGGSNGNDGIFSGTVSAGTELLSIVSLSASAGTQRNSGTVRLEGQGWNGTASVPVEFRSYVKPTAGTANPTYDYIVEARHNRGSWTQLMRIQTGENGNVFTTGTVSASFGATFVTSLDVAGQFRAGGTTAGTRIRAGDNYQWTSSTTDPQQAADLFLGRRAAANLRLGAVDAASPVAQTLSVQSATGSNSSAAAAVFSFDGSQGTGSGAGGDIRIRTTPAGAAGSTANAYVETIRARAGRGIAVSNGNFATASDCIGEVTVLRGNTSGTTPVILSESALGGGLSIQLNAVMQALVLVQGISDAGDVAKYARMVCVKNIAGTSSLQGSVITLGADDSGTTALAITVSDTNDTLDISVTGTAGNNWRWNAVIFGGELVRNISG